MFAVACLYLEMEKISMIFMKYYYSSFINVLFVSFPWCKVTHLKPQGEGICISTHSITINCASFERGAHLSENHIDLTVSQQIYWKNKNKKAQSESSAKPD